MATFVSSAAGLARRHGWFEGRKGTWNVWCRNEKRP
ncbi:hypothetical protein VDGL01_08133 [Verticillium dahliae]|nr:hypothetical protein VD0003_g7933 [Verticillium dahliae]